MYVLMYLCVCTYSLLVKFRFSEKATKFWKKYLICFETTELSKHQNRLKFFSNFVAFSQCLTPVKTVLKSTKKTKVKAKIHNMSSFLFLVFLSYTVSQCHYRQCQLLFGLFQFWLKFLKISWRIPRSSVFFQSRILEGFWWPLVYWEI